MTDPVALRPPSEAQVSQAAAETFRPIHYMGSKARLVELIGTTIDQVDPSGGPVLDLFSGSGVVAASLSRERDVTAVDVQEYSRVLALALMRPARRTKALADKLAASSREATAGIAERLAPLLDYERASVTALAEGDPEPLCEIVEHGSLAAFGLEPSAVPTGLSEVLQQAATVLTQADNSYTLTRYYGGVYFGYAQALALDGLLSAIRALPEGRQRTTALATALGVASEAVSSVGSHFAQPVRPRDGQGRPKSTALTAVAKRRRLNPWTLFGERLQRYATLPGAAQRATAVRRDYRHFLASYGGEVAAVYADPPYTRDHYSRFYHVLETMARGDRPDISTVSTSQGDLPSRGLYRRDRHQSPFCIRSQAPEAFQTLFAGVRALEAPLILSYSPYSEGTAARPNTRLLTIAEIVELGSEAFSAVAVHSGGPLRHSKFNARRLNGVAESEAESLIVCQP
jgi:adenine-specific DNA-methyltransferase